MPGGKYIVFNNLRPPVCIDETDGSPLRMKAAKQRFALAQKQTDSISQNITKQFIVKNITDDGHLDYKNWNLRHFVHPSKFNENNSTFYRVRFVH